MTLLRFAALFALLAIPAHAAGFNVDFGSGNGAPAAKFAGPAKQAGQWNVVTGSEPAPVELFDVDAVASHVTLSIPGATSSTAYYPQGGSVAALMADGFRLPAEGSVLKIDGLPAGAWDVMLISSSDLGGTSSWSVRVQGGAPVSVKLAGGSAALLAGAQIIPRG